MGLPQMLTTVQVARLFGAETPEEIKTRQAYLAQLRFRGTRTTVREARADDPLPAVSRGRMARGRRNELHKERMNQ